VPKNQADDKHPLTETVGEARRCRSGGCAG